jgi:hypothetical protein
VLRLEFRVGRSVGAPNTAPLRTALGRKSTTGAPKGGTLRTSQFRPGGVVSSRASAGTAVRRDGVRNPAWLWVPREDQRGGPHIVKRFVPECIVRAQCVQGNT